MSDSAALKRITESLIRVGTSAAADAMVKLGFGVRAISTKIRPIGTSNACIGPAFTIRGKTNADAEAKLAGLSLMDKITDGSVVVVDSNGPQGVGHWGELMTIAAQARGAQGAVIQGGCRDVVEISKLGFPVFAEYATPCEAISLYCMDACQIPVMLPTAVGGQIEVQPGDYVFCDSDGGVVIPHAALARVADEADRIRQAELRAIDALRRGASVRDVFSEAGIA